MIIYYTAMYKTIIDKAIDDIGKTTVGTNHDTNLAMGSGKYRRFVARCVPNRFVPKMLFPIFSNQFTIRGNDHRGVEAFVFISFQHSCDDLNPKFFCQRLKFFKIRTFRDWFAEIQIFFERD